MPAMLFKIWNGKTIPAGRIVELCGLIRKYAPGCRIKINTVVSVLNKDEMRFDFIDKISRRMFVILVMMQRAYARLRQTALLFKYIKISFTTFYFSTFLRIEFFIFIKFFAKIVSFFIFSAY